MPGENLLFCICENRGADQLRGYGAADQSLCFRYIDNTIPLLPKTGILKLGFCWTWSKPQIKYKVSSFKSRENIPKTGFLATRLIFDISVMYCPLVLILGLSGDDTQCFIVAHCLVLSSTNHVSPLYGWETYEPRHEKTNVLVSDLV